MNIGIALEQKGGVLSYGKANFKERENHRRDITAKL